MKDMSMLIDMKVKNVTEGLKYIVMMSMVGMNMMVERCLGLVLLCIGLEKCLVVVVGENCIGNLTYSVGIFLASMSLGMMYKGFDMTKMDIEVGC